MRARILPGPLSGRVPAVSSKSHAHRLMIAAALSGRETAIRLDSPGEDLFATAACIRAMGGGAEFSKDGVLISPIRAEKSAACSLDFNESGSTARFLLPVAAALFESCEFSGRGRLPQRPFSGLCGEMEKNGCKFSSHGLPMRVSGRLAPGVFSLPGNVSSQYISGLLLAAPLLPGPSEIRLSGPLESAAYVDMTLGVLENFGIRAQKTEFGFWVPGGQEYSSPGTAAAEGDWSNAAFWLCAGALSGPVTVAGLVQDSLQGDREIVTLLRRFGADVTILGQDVRVSPAPTPLSGIEIDASQIPDLVPVLAHLAAAAEGETRIYNAGRLRQKESDRLFATVQNILALGGDARAGEDYITINGRPRPLPGGEADGFGDHRIVMSAAILAPVCSGPVTVSGAEAAAKSYPGFFEDFKGLGGRVALLLK